MTPPRLREKPRSVRVYDALTRITCAQCTSCGHGCAADTVKLVGNEAQERAVLVEERALQAAMTASDVDELDRLLHPELLAVGPDGQLIDKAGDLGSHRSGVFRITELREEEVRVKVVGDTAVTFVVLGIRGTIADADVSGRMRYTRTWTRAGGAWQVVAAHISSLPEGAERESS